MSQPPCLSQSGHAMILSFSHHALSCRKQEKGSLIILVARQLVSDRFLSHMDDRDQLEAIYRTVPPEMNVKVRIVWITKETPFQGQMDNFNTHVPIFSFNENQPQIPDTEVFPPKWIHDRLVDEIILEGTDPSSLPIFLPTRMEVFDDSLVPVDPAFIPDCPTKNDARPGCRSKQPPKLVWEGVLEEYKTEFGEDPTFVSITADEQFSNHWYDGPRLLSTTNSLAVLGLEDTSTYDAADAYLTPESGYTLRETNYLVKKNVLISAIRDMQDRGIEVDLSEYGSYPEFDPRIDQTGRFGSRQGRLFRELSFRLSYAIALHQKGIFA